MISIDIQVCQEDEPKGPRAPYKKQVVGSTI